jgi:ribosome-associated protein
MDPELIRLVAHALRDKKATNIMALDVRGISNLTDALIIAEGTVDRHVKALAQEVMAQLEPRGLRPTYTEGESEGDWIVLDYLDFMVHLFTPAFRDKYRLEELWGEGKLIPLRLEPLVTA